MRIPSRTVLAMMLWTQSFTTHAQEKFIWLKLTDNHVIINAKFQEVRGESLMVYRGSGSLTLPMADIRQFRVIKEAPIMQRSLVGAGAGAVTGGLVGVAAGSGQTNIWSIGTSAILFGVIGGIIGGVSASFDEGGAIIDCSGKTSAEIKELIERKVGETINPTR